MITCCRSKMAVALDEKEKRQLQTWMGKRKNFNLLYKASVDGCNSGTFYTKCNNKGPTVSVFYNTHGTVYGGYNPRSWSSAGNVYDQDAFIFRLRYNGQPKLLQIQPKQQTGYEYSIFDSSSYGPSFGYNSNSGGYDFQSFSGNIKWNGTYFQLNGSHGFGGYAYNMQGENYNSIANGSNQVTDIEVYQLEGTWYFICHVSFRKYRPKWLQYFFFYWNKFYINNNGNWIE